jgi:hypothetical protein
MRTFTPKIQYGNYQRNLFTLQEEKSHLRGHLQDTALLSQLLLIRRL